MEIVILRMTGRISHKLAISQDELIDRYIRRGLFEDNYFTRPQFPLRLVKYLKGVLKLPKNIYFLPLLIRIFTLFNFYSQYEN